MRPSVLVALLAGMLCASTLAGCQLFGVQPPTTKTTGSSAAQSLVSNNAASLAGVVTGPSWLVSNNTGNLVSNNSGNLVSNNSGGLVSNNTGSYRITTLDLVPVPKAMVYLTSPDEQFYVGSNGKALYTLTSDQGAYSFKEAPANVPVIATVLLPQNRRMVGFLTTQQGSNSLDVDLATTVVTEYLRDQAKLAHRTMGDYPGLTTKLGTIVKLTRDLIASGQLSEQLDLSVNAIPALRNAYVQAFAATDKPLSDAWKDLLGYRPLLIDELDVGLAPGMTPTAVAVSSTSIYTAATNPFNLAIIETTNGSTRSITLAPRELGIAYIGGMVASGSHLFLGAAGYGQIEIDTTFPPDQLLINLGTGATGSNFVQSNGGLDPNGNSDAYDVALGGGWVYVTSSNTNEVYQYHLDGSGLATDVQAIAGIPAASQSPNQFFTGDVAAPGTQVRLNYPTNLTYHVEGSTPYLYVADTLNHRIRRINLADPSFATETVLGVSTLPYGNILLTPGPLEDGKAANSAAQGYPDIDDPAGVPKDKVWLDYPHTIRFDAAGRMFFADSDHRRVRMFDGTRVYTIAGCDGGSSGGSGDSRRVSLGEVSSIAFDAAGNLLVADSRSSKLRRIRMPFGL